NVSTDPEFAARDVVENSLTLDHIGRSDIERGRFRSCRHHQQHISCERETGSSRAADFKWGTRHPGWRPEFPSQERRREFVALTNDREPIVRFQLSADGIEGGAQRWIMGIVLECDVAEALLRHR